jgi:ABC-2 type transport system ATP-binding protein
MKNIDNHELEKKDLDYGIILKKVSKLFGNKKVLDEIDLSVKYGEICGLIGFNGSGKTTLLSIISGMIKKTSGEVIVDSKDIEINSDFNINLAHVSSEPDFPLKMTVLDYIKSCAFLRDIEEEELFLKIENSELKDHWYKYCTELSTGFKKILQLFCVSLYNPKIIILDEPFNGLDYSFKKILMENLEEIRNKNHCLLITSHNLEELEFINHVVILSNGKKVHDSYLDSEEKKLKKILEDFFVKGEKKII